jgi:hypothetical protein
MEICSSHYREDLEWLKKSKFPVTVIGHEGESPHDFQGFTIPNIGCELTSYLFFILKRWDSLPEWTAFIHGHKDAWHQKAQIDLLTLIETANVKKYNFIPLNNYYVSKYYNGQSDFGKRFIKMYMHMSGQYLPPHVFIPACGQYIVSARVIKRYPYETYVNIYKFIIAQCPEDSKVGADCVDILFNTLFGPKNSYLHLVNYPRTDFFDPPIQAEPFILFDTI